MDFVQSGALGSVKTRFVFGGDALEFTEEVGSTQRTFAVPYEQIPLEHSTVTTISRHFARVYIALLIVLIAGIFAAFLSGAGPGRQGSAAGGALLTSLLLMIVGRVLVRPRARITVTVFKTPLGSIEVLGGENRDAILGAIDEKRRGAVRAKHARINPASHPQNEMARFRLLKDKGFITEAELSDALSRLAALLPPQGFPPPAETPKRPLS